MGKLSTHVLDTASGRPGVGIRLRLLKIIGSSFSLLKSAVTNTDGRVTGALLEGTELTAGMYRLEFEIGPYFRSLGYKLPDPAFLETVHLDFGIANPEENYHVPLVTTPWSYSTYRGS